MLRHIQEIGLADLRSPALVLDINAENTYSGDAIDVSRYLTAWCLIRRANVPVAIRILDIESESFIHLDQVREHFAAQSLPGPTRRSAVLDATLTVVICTRDRPAGLRRAVDSLAKQSDTDFDVLVVDNSADGGATPSLGQVDGLSIRCLHEPAPGLSRARNRALSEIDTELVAWIDDDEVADPEWIAWLKRGFSSTARPDAIAGVMLPAELEVSAQVDWERYGGHLKGRGLEPLNLTAGTSTVIDPLYPRPIFGSGGNMAFRTEKLRAIGGFDNCLGTGTLTRGGEDTKALSLLLDAGSSILHWPPAIVWHYHRRTERELELMLFGNSAGLTAYYTSLVLSSRTYLHRVIKLIPLGVKEVSSHAREIKEISLPKNLSTASRRGLIQGPWLYIREMLRQRQCDRRLPLVLTRRRW